MQVITFRHILALILVLIPAILLSGCIDERELASLQEENRVLRDKNQRLTLENEGLKQNIEKLKTKEANLEANIEEIERTIEELKGKISHLGKRKEELQTLLGNLRAINEALREKIAEYGIEIKVVKGVEGLKGEYFNLPSFPIGKPPKKLPESSSPYKIFMRIDKIIDFRGHPGGPNLSRWCFGIRWTGFIYIPVTGDYRFDIGCGNNGVRVWINNKLMYDQWHYNKSHFAIFTDLIGKRWYPIKIETYYRWRNVGSPYFAMILEWWLPGATRKEVIPSSNLKTGPIVIESEKMKIRYKDKKIDSTNKTF